MTLETELRAPTAAPSARSIPLYGAGSRSRAATREVRAYAIVDEVDHAALAMFRWHVSDTGYACRWEGPRGARRRVRMHREVIGAPLGAQVDHINRDKLDNRRTNLRLATDATNRQNVPARGGYSRHRGVSFDKGRGKWVAQAKLEGKHKFIGRFDTEEAAAAAASAWRRENMPFATD